MTATPPSPAPDPPPPLSGEPPGQPCGVPPENLPGPVVGGRPYSPLRQRTAGLMQLLPGVVLIGGMGRLYAGHTSLGVAQMLTGAGFGWCTLWSYISTDFPGPWPTALVVVAIWTWFLVDALGLLIGRPEDRDGRRLRLSWRRPPE